MTEANNTQVSATSEAPAQAVTGAPNKEQIIAAIKPVIDPEIGISIVDLGLIYDGNMIENNTAHVLMTLTSPMCPMGPQIMGEVHQAVQVLEGVDDVKVELTFDPPWDPKNMCDEDTKMMLGIF